MAKQGVATSKASAAIFNPRMLFSLLGDQHDYSRFSAHRPNPAH
jgi:hypothetical protein